MNTAHENYRHPRLVLVGGFLGAGKTSLLWEAARRLTLRGERVGLITNDQAPGLVDTTLLSMGDGGVREVAGSCFCCNFPGFLEAARSLADEGATWILAEPVGSCTDLSATILQPLKERHPEFELSPLSVLVDAARVREVFQREHPLLHPDAAYILRLQLEEADTILLSKADQLDPVARAEGARFLKEEVGDTPVSFLSSHEGEGVDAWLDYLTAGGLAGQRIVPVDYDRYAHGEAVLGWLNAVVELRWIDGTEADWKGFAAEWLANIQSQLRADSLAVGHIKLLLESGEGQLAMNLVSLDEPVLCRETGELTRLRAVATINARAQVSPDGMEQMVRSGLERACHGRVSPQVRALHCLQPGRPTPTHRYSTVVG